jgi:MarR-like DNA-binding transcriptional regulator SgrR of sgrS sRNA
MKRFVLHWVVVSSLLLVTAAETRPQYGGTLHVAMQTAPMTLDPADTSQANAVAYRNVLRLVYDCLVTMDDEGRLQPALATSWRAESGNRRWQFQLRPGVKFHDGSPLTAEAVAASLRSANQSWTVLAATDSVIMQRDVADPDLPAQLALARNSIAKRVPGSAFVGTGPFRITSWQAGKGVMLAANEEYWGGRSFLDGVELEFGRSVRDQLIDLDLNKIQVAEVAAEQSHKLAEEKRRISNSAPIELLALVFARDAQSDEEQKIRDVLALCIDRASIRSGVLGDAGDPTAAILPDGISGYAFVFSAERNLTRAQEERGDIARAPAMTLGYDPDDAVARVIAERIVLNAREAGLTLQTVSGTKADMGVKRIEAVSSNPRIALGASAMSLGVPAPNYAGASIDDVFVAESKLLRGKKIIPLFQLPISYAISHSVQGWKMGRDGSWHLADVWLGGTP